MMFNVAIENVPWLPTLHLSYLVEIWRWLDRWHGAGQHAILPKKKENLQLESDESSELVFRISELCQSWQRVRYCFRGKEGRTTKGEHFVSSLALSAPIPVSSSRISYSTECVNYRATAEGGLRWSRYGWTTSSAPAKNLGRHESESDSDNSNNNDTASNDIHSTCDAVSIAT